MGSEHMITVHNRPLFGDLIASASSFNTIEYRKKKVAMLVELLVYCCNLSTAAQLGHFLCVRMLCVLRIGLAACLTHTDFHHLGESRRSVTLF
jgi:hypothetical protein